MSAPTSTAIALQAAAQLVYVRALQRKGRAMLARTAAEELSPCRWDDWGSHDVR